MYYFSEKRQITQHHCKNTVILLHVHIIYVQGDLKLNVNHKLINKKKKDNILTFYALNLLHKLEISK